MLALERRADGVWHLRSSVGLLGRQPSTKKMQLVAQGTQTDI